MVGIYEISNGLNLVAVSKDEASAKKALFNQFEPHPDWYSNIDEWWESGKRESRGVPHAFEIEEVEVWIEE